MALNPLQVAALWKEVLDLSRLNPAESVIVLTKPEANPRNLEGALAAINEIGANAFVMTPMIGKAPLRTNRAVMEALKSADMVVDFMGLHLLRGTDKNLKISEKNEVTGAGTRVLFAVEPPETLQRLMPTPEDKRRVCAAGAKLAAAQTMRIDSDAGTDLKVSLGDFGVGCRYGYADEPGHWDHWPAGFVSIEPNERTAEGVVVIAAGDIIFPFNSYAQTAIRLEIHNGYIRKIEGGVDAVFLRDYFAKYDDPEAYAVSHLGWGLQAKADWTMLGILKNATNGNDGRAFYGNFMFSTGPNLAGGGTRDTLCHLDMPMRDCSVYLDNEPMVIRGAVIPEDQRVPGRPFATS